MENPDRPLVGKYKWCYDWVNEKDKAKRLKEKKQTEDWKYIKEKWQMMFSEFYRETDNKYPHQKAQCDTISSLVIDIDDSITFNTFKNMYRNWTWLLRILFIIGNHLGQHIFHATNNDIVSNGVDRSIWIGVDGDDNGAFLHTDGVLYLSADTTSDVELGTYCNTRLPYHAVDVNETRIYSGTTSAYLSMQFFGKVKK